MNDDTLANILSASSPEHITQLGEKIYLDELKEKLEPQESGKYVVLDVETKKYFIDPNLLIALQKAEKQFPDKLFYIVRVGNLQKLQKRFHRDWLRTR